MKSENSKKQGTGSRWQSVKSFSIFSFVHSFPEHTFRLSGRQQFFSHFFMRYPHFFHFATKIMKTLRF